MSSRNIIKDDKEDKWFDGKDYIAFASLTPDHLQNAFTRCLKKVLYYHNRAGVFDKLSEKLEEEAERRGIKLIDPDTEFHRRNRILKNKIKKIQ